MQRKDFLKLIISIILPLLAGFIGSYFTTPAIDAWYAELQKPAINPPDWVFAPAWTTLYILMGIALFLVWRKKDEIKNFLCIAVVFGIQLVLNATWSIVFFGMENPLLGLINILLLLVAIVLTMILFFRAFRPAGYLLVPYLLWVLFATYLNFQILILN